MIKFSRIRIALTKPAWRWKEFFVSSVQDVIAISLAFLIASKFVAAASQLGGISGWIFTATVCTLAGVWLNIWRNQYSTEPRYFGLHDALNLALVASILGFIAGLGNFIAGNSGLAALALQPTLFVGLAFVGIAGRRTIERFLATRRAENRDDSKSARSRTLVVGAGDAGEAIIREARRSRASAIEVVGLVDDDPLKQSLRIHGVPVRGRVDQIVGIVERNSIDEVFIAMPSAYGAEIRRVFEQASRTTARVRTLPALGSLVGGDGKALLPQLRTVEIQDLLRREPVKTNLEQVRAYLGGEHVLVTGAGGSIGSELVRQIAQMNPASLTLVGKGENSIYEIEQEIIQTCGLVPYTTIADVRDRESMNLVFERCRPTVVFHAAAHKHVPLMEKNPREAILNNVHGTYITAELSVQYGVKKFILISTDKAVKPSSIMGASKRVCEMIVSSFAQASETEFAAVRFGNVLGSRGSLIPLLQAQIRRGGPVTITHKDMTRFFMTIPEAAQLVLQAGAIGKRGELFILDMGEPIKIIDLAVELIRMHGLMPNEDIPIKFTGMRPGEKMHEELVYESEDLIPTEHPKIRMVHNKHTMSLSDVRACLDRLFGLFDEPERLAQYLQDLAWEKNLPLVPPPMSSEGQIR